MNRYLSQYRENEEPILGWGFIVLFLLVWEFIPHVVTLPKGLALFFTTPYHIALRLVEMSTSGEVRFTLRSATEFVIGLGLSILVALPVGLVMGRFNTLNAMFDPFVTAFNATPRLVFLPLVVLWFGFGIWSTVVIVFIGALFPLLINTYEGVKNVDRVLVNVVRSFGANEWQLMKIVVLPNSLPYIIAGLRLAIGRAILGVVVGEFFGSDQGIGYLMAAAGQLRLGRVLRGLICYGISLLMTLAVKSWRTGSARWRPEQVKTSETSRKDWHCGGQAEAVPPACIEVSDRTYSGLAAGSNPLSQGLVSISGDELLTSGMGLSWAEVFAIMR